MSENANDLKADTKEVVKETAAGKPISEADVQSLRFLSVKQIDSLINSIISANPEAFENYFMLLRVREQNKITVTKPVETTDDVEK